MSALRLSLFGTFQAEIAGQSLVFPTQKVRALLVYLVLNPGPHWRDSLATLLWGEFPDQSARRSVARSLNRLRESLAPLLLEDPDLLQVDRQTIQLCPNPEVHHVDVCRFEHLLQACHTHEHETVPGCPPCILRLQEAVALYQGLFLDGFTLPDAASFSDWQLLRQESYLEQTVGALHTLTDAALLAQEPAHARTLLQQQLSLMPWREKAHRQLMHLLAQDGQRSAALAQYERCQQALSDALGVEPERETTVLYERIKRGAVSHNLPTPITPLIGQASALTEITTRLCDPACRLLTLVGLGGIGKSRLALEAARRLTGTFRDGIYLVSLAGVDGGKGQASDLLREATLSTLQAAGVLPQEVDSPPEVVLQATFRDKQILLILA